MKMLSSISTALAIMLVVTAVPVALAHDGARDGTRDGAEATRSVWPAPVGHRQPRVEDIPAGPQKRAYDEALERLQRALDGKLMICRGC